MKKNLLKSIKQRFCNHEWELCKKVSMFSCISGEQIYRRCKKCGKVEEAFSRQYEGGSYK